GEGYTGGDNIHFRLEVFRGGTEPVILWSRDNGSTVLPLTADVAAEAMSLQVSPESAQRLRAGDLVVIEDRVARLQPDGASPPILRRVRGVQAETGKLELTEASDLLTASPFNVAVGGAVGRTFSVTQGAAVRRWDGGDALVIGVRYRTFDGITFAFDGSDFRVSEWWSFTARVRAPDGASRGMVEKLTEAPPQGPVHHFVPLARVRGGAVRQFEDLRPRYLPLREVRDRLAELGSRVVGPPVFTVVVGDGKRSFGDIDQDLLGGVTGDEALQAAVDRLGGAGGSIYIRAGQYDLEHPVLLRGLSSLLLLGDGDATQLRALGAGGALYLDRCGLEGAVRIERLHLVENTQGQVDIGAPGDGGRFAPLTEADERPLSLDDLHRPAPTADFLTHVGERIKTLLPGQGRAAASVVATLIQLRRLQRRNPGRSLEEVPAAVPLLEALERVPHGVVTLADSSRVRIEDCRIDGLDRSETGSDGLSVGVLITGTGEGLELSGNRITAATGVAVAPYAPSFSDRFLAQFPRAGLFIRQLDLVHNRIQALGAKPASGIHVVDGTL
ncbi:MAG TPA: hypothetical protein VEY30_05885, partial [Myxococcaceae bacterium]|nr:hypothetical protein [Myxococcaceae bacterium]